jgi:hypothetical protein
MTVPGDLKTLIHLTTAMRHQGWWQQRLQFCVPTHMFVEEIGYAALFGCCSHPSE